MLASSSAAAAQQLLRKVPAVPELQRWAAGAVVSPRRAPVACRPAVPSIDAAVAESTGGCHRAAASEGRKTAGKGPARGAEKRRVRFDLGAVTVHEVTPYSQVYGVHPRDFAFERDDYMVLLAPGTGHWLTAATVGSDSPLDPSDLGDSGDDAAQQQHHQLDLCGTAANPIGSVEDSEEGEEVEEGWVLVGGV